MSLELLKMGYVDYFLIVWDLLIMRKKGYGSPVSSAAGALFHSWYYQINPEYNLLFERFLNPERVTMPDIDID